LPVVGYLDVGLHIASIPIVSLHFGGWRFPGSSHLEHSVWQQALKSAPPFTVSRLSASPQLRRGPQKRQQILRSVRVIPGSRLGNLHFSAAPK
jgi:hypothetical protein